MRTSIQARLGSSFHPDPSGCVTLVASPLLSPEHARGWCDVEVAFGTRHSSGAGVTRYLHDLRRAFTTLAIGPWTGQLAVFVTMLDALLHRINITSVVAMHSPCAF